MKVPILAVLIFGVAITGFWILQETEPKNPPKESSLEATIQPSEPAPAGMQQPSDSPSSEFQLDRFRLYDKGYELDPGLQAAARELGIAPACYIAIAKEHFDQVPVGQECPDPKEASLKGEPGFVIESGPDEPHRYDNFSDDDLKALAYYDPEAAIVLARRVQDDSLSRHYYKQAVILTGNPRPLVEWLIFRNRGGITTDRRGRILNVEQAKTGYKTYLIASAFGLSEGPAESYREDLVAAGIDLESTERAAAEEVDEIKEKRKSIVPNNNEER